MKWLKSIWTWVIGAPIIATVASLLFGWWRKPQKPVPTITKEQAHSEHELIEEGKDAVFDKIDAEVDQELKDVLSKFGG